MGPGVEDKIVKYIEGNMPKTKLPESSNSSECTNSDIKQKKKSVKGAEALSETFAKNNKKTCNH